MRLISKQLIGTVPKNHEGIVRVIDGKIAVVAPVGDKQQLRWGEWHSALYDKVNSPDEVSGGKPLFSVREGADNDSGRYRMVWGDEVGKAYRGLTDGTIVHGKPMYAAFAENHTILVHGEDEEPLFYSSVFDFRVVESQPLYRAIIASSRRQWPPPAQNQCVVWGSQQGQLYDYVGSIGVYEGELVYEGRRGEQAMAVRGGVEGPEYWGNIGPVFVSQGKLIYQARSSRDETFVVWGGREGRRYGAVWMLTVADGKPLYSAGTGNTQSPADNMRVVWGEEEFKPYHCVQSPRIVLGKPLFMADLQESGKHDYRVVWGDQVITPRKGYQPEGLLLGQIVCSGGETIGGAHIRWGDWESPRCEKLIEIGFGEMVSPDRWERRYAETLADNGVRYYARTGNEVHEMVFKP